MSTQSLRRTINLAILLVGAVAALIFGTVTAYQESKRFKNDMENVRLLCSAVYHQQRESLANEIFSRTMEALRFSLRSILEVRGIIGAAVYDKQGKPLMSEPELHLPPLSPDEIQRLSQQNQFERIERNGAPAVVFGTDVEVIGECVGFLRIYYDISPLIRETQFRYAFLALMLITVVFGMAVIMNQILYRTVVAPAMKLRTVMNKVREGYLGEQVTLKSQGEIGEMASAFNDMSAKLQENSNELMEAAKSRDESAVKLEKSYKELEELNRVLEAKVEERTQELRSANEELNRTIVEISNHNHQTAVLNRMGELLMACRTQEEAYRVLCRSIHELYPESRGALYILDKESQLNLPAAQWNGYKSEHRSFSVDECWALRRRKPHSAKNPKEAALCGLMVEKKEHAYLCVPVVTHEEVFGVLHIEYPFQQDSVVTDSVLENAKGPVSAAAEHAALALANLSLRERLRGQAIRDPLTDLYNRRFMEESMTREAGRAMRRRHSLGMIMLDLDHFKRINDTYGHEAGDILLKIVADYLTSKIRSEDIACRYGGEEFVLILPESAPDDTYNRAEDLRKGIARDCRLLYQGKDLGQITVSLGTASFPEDADDPVEVLKKADRAMYTAKTSGRNRTVRWSDQAA